MRGSMPRKFRGRLDDRWSSENERVESAERALLQAHCASRVGRPKGPGQPAFGGECTSEGARDLRPRPRIGARVAFPHQWNYGTTRRLAESDPGRLRAGRPGECSRVPKAVVDAVRR